jgi:hypothetical protein
MELAIFDNYSYDFNCVYRTDFILLAYINRLGSMSVGRAMDAKTERVGC